MNVYVTTVTHHPITEARVEMTRQLNGTQHSTARFLQIDISTVWMVALRRMPQGKSMTSTTSGRHEMRVDAGGHITASCVRSQLTVKQLCPLLWYLHHHRPAYHLHQSHTQADLSKLIRQTDYEESKIPKTQ